jgi:RimJ/RimL family protein N-acetyltransferase
MNAPIIETDRLLLRQWEAVDVEPYGRMLADPATARFIVPGGEPVKPQRAWEHAFVVADRGSGDFLGRVGVWSPPGWFGLEVGWGIVPEARGQGIALEASVAAMRWTFENSGAAEIIHCIDDENLPSQRLAARLGAREGRAILLWGRPAKLWETGRHGFTAVHG